MLDEGEGGGRFKYFVGRGESRGATPKDGGDGTMGKKGSDNTNQRGLRGTGGCSEARRTINADDVGGEGEGSGRISCRPASGGRVQPSRKRTPPPRPPFSVPAVPACGPGPVGLGVGCGWTPLESRQINRADLISSAARLINKSPLAVHSPYGPAFCFRHAAGAWRGQQVLVCGAVVVVTVEWHGASVIERRGHLSSCPSMCSLGPSLAQAAAVPICTAPANGQCLQTQSTIPPAESTQNPACGLHPRAYR